MPASPHHLSDGDEANLMIEDFVNFASDSVQRSVRVGWGEVVGDIYARSEKRKKNRRGDAYYDDRKRKHK